MKTGHDPDPNAQASYFTAQVNYGDGSGTSTATTIAVDPNVVGGWIVSASHTFILGGSLSATVTITDAADGTNDNAITAASSATVAVPAPASLYANGISTGEIDLSWTLVSNDVANVEIDRSADGQTWSALATLSAAPTSYADTSAVAATPYWYRAIASEGPSYTGAAQSPPSTPAEAIAPPATPTATALDGNSVQLQWTSDPSASVGFNLQRTSNIDTGTTTFTNVSTGYTDITALDGVPYTYALVATAGSVSSNPSAATTVTTPLAPPTGFSATPISTGEIDLTWSLTSSQQDIVTVERSTDNQTFTDLATVNPGTMMFNDTSIPAAQSHYWYQLISAEQYFGASPNLVSAVSAPSDTWSLPVAPSGLTASFTTANAINEVDLSWTNTSQNASQFSVQRTDSSGNTTVVGTVNAPVTTFADLTAAGGQTYQYSVAVVTTDAGTSGPSSAVTVTTPALSVDSLGSTVVSSTEIDLAWNVSLGDATGINVYASTDGQSYSLLTQTPLPPDATSYQATGLTPDTANYYEVIAVGSATLANPSFSQTGPVTTLPDTPVLSASGTTVQLSWTGDFNASTTSFNIYRTDSSGHQEFIDNSLTNSYVDTSASRQLELPIRRPGHYAGGSPIGSLQ